MLNVPFTILSPKVLAFFFENAKTTIGNQIIGFKRLLASFLNEGSGGGSGQIYNIWNMWKFFYKKYIEVYQ